MRLGSGAGIGQKPDDWNAVSLCQHHHSEQHRLGEASFWQRIAQHNPQEMIAAFINASPKRAEIQSVRRERESSTGSGGSLKSAPAFGR